MKKNAFYMVYLEHGRGSTYKHETFESAEAEAKRLSREYGRKAYVLATVKSYEKIEFHTEDLMPDMDELPF